MAKSEVKVDLILRWSEVHWYEAKVTRAELAEVLGRDPFQVVPTGDPYNFGDDFAGFVMSLAGFREGDRPGRGGRAELRGIDGVEVGGISRA